MFSKKWHAAIVLPAAFMICWILPLVMGSGLLALLLVLLPFAAVVLLAACGSNKAIDDKKAVEIALKDLGITEDQAESIDAHVGTRDEVAGYNVYITYNKEHFSYFINGKTGEIMHKGNEAHSHSH